MEVVFQKMFLHSLAIAQHENAVFLLITLKIKEQVRHRAVLFLGTSLELPLF